MGYKQAKNSFLAVGQGHGPRGQHRKVYPLSMQVKEASSRGGWVGGRGSRYLLHGPLPALLPLHGRMQPLHPLDAAPHQLFVHPCRRTPRTPWSSLGTLGWFAPVQCRAERGRERGGGRKGGREGDHGAAARLVQRVGRVVVCVCVCWQRPFKLLPGTRHSQLQKWPTPHGPTCHGGHAPGTAVVRP